MLDLYNRSIKKMHLYVEMVYMQVIDLEKKRRGFIISNKNRAIIGVLFWRFNNKHQGNKFFPVFCFRYWQVGFVHMSDMKPIVYTIE